LYLYLGQETVIRMRDIIGIFDLEDASTEQITKDYLAMSQKAGRILVVTADLPRSFVVCSAPKQKGFSVYLSQFSPGTLMKRVNDPYSGN
jgi:hypothetical protein